SPTNNQRRSEFDDNLNFQAQVWLWATSVIVHLENELPSSNNRGDSLLHPIIQFESLTAENGTLITDAGNVLNRR
ncbi:MAG: hypothetical protein AAF404_05295, partial [Pseudomonadota bacterium]